MSPSGAVFNIQRFSLHDGPGIRTTVFLKGCSLACFWCHNPEGRRPRPELQFFQSRCISCGACVEACPHGVHEFVDGVHVLHRDRCQAEGACVAACYAGALQFSGEIMSVERVMEEILRDQVFYQNSGGGVTLSGGEPALEREFTFAILKQCKDHHIHTAIETCGEVPWEFLEQLLPVTDLVMMDLKQMGPDRHREATGKSNERIVANAEALARSGKPLIFRTPVVPTVNDSADDIAEIAAFVRELQELRKEQTNGGAGIEYELLAFHRLAADKYRSLGMEYGAASLDPPPRQHLLHLAEVAERFGVTATVR
jgi:pyruvate formate lyase activating enzyme